VVSEALQSALVSGLSSLSITVSDRQTEQLLDYLSLLIKWNRAYNLTAVKEPLEMVRKHLLDSLAISPWVQEGDLLDVGAGAGLPGIPLAIIKPNLSVDLVDSAGKKVRFLHEVRRQLALPNVQAHHCRVEALAGKREFQQIVSRAFASLDHFIQLTEPLLSADGRWLAMKGRSHGDEVANLKAKVQVVANEPIVVPQLDEVRALVVLQKAF